jgi:hypothetical protein
LFPAAPRFVQPIPNYQKTMTAAQKYKLAKADFFTLGAIAELEDQVEIDAQMDQFMANPTKAFAAMLYETKIEMWFREHGVTPETEEIADRWNLG